jgi:pyruvate dehydrogenase E2 component (dihydrolipoyllysine-residue acetyltransferase)
MTTEVILPKVDMVMETGTFVEWLKQEGETVEKGQPLFVIMTDKAAIEIEAPASGILSGVKAKADDVIPVSQTIAYILQPGEKLPAGGQAGPATTADRVASQPETSEITAPAAVEATPQAEILRGKVRATPIARRMAAELGIDLAAVRGRGPQGRVHRADVLEAAEKQVKQAAEAPVSIAQAIPSVGLQISLPDARRKDVIPLTGPRKIIAQRMAYSAAVAPHITLSVSVDMSEASRLRSRVLAQIEQKTGQRLSFTAIFIRALATILPRHPYLNASLAGEEIILWEDVHLGVATSLEEYLIVPVIRQAQEKNLEQIVMTLADLVERARTKRLTPSEMSGSTFTISNLGMFGIESFTAIINPPESAILAVGKIVDTYIKVENEMALRPVMNLTISADHRIVDGAAAANFLVELKNTLENPYLLI